MSATLPANEFSIGIIILYVEFAFANSKVASKVAQATISASGKSSRLARCE